MLAFTRGASACVVNFGDRPYPLPEAWSATVALASAPELATDGRTLVDANSAVWLTVDREAAASFDGGQMVEVPQA